MNELTRQQLCARLGISESTVRRLEARGMPYTKTEWSQRKTYNLVEVGRWMRASGIDKTPELASDGPRNYYGANARAKAIQRMPAWANKKAIKMVYELARRLTQETGVLHHVDHVIPLVGREVSGLHVEANLQVLTFIENSQKHNYFEVGA